LREEQVHINARRDKELHQLENDCQAKLKDQKKALKEKYLAKLTEAQTQMQNDLQSKLSEIQTLSDTKSANQSKLGQSALDSL